MPKVSVLMPAYNSGKYIQQSIQSILDQTFQDFELIIVNDGSTDNTHDIITSFSDDRIRYYQNDGNKGLIYTRNKQINLASTEYIALLDSDDLANKLRLEIEYGLLNDKNNLSFVSSSFYMIDENNNIINDKNVFKLDYQETKTLSLFLNPVATSSIMFKKSHLPKELFRKEYPVCEDYDLWTRIMIKGEGIVIPDYLVSYRIYNESICKKVPDLIIDRRNQIVLNQLNHYFPNLISEEEKMNHLSLVDFSLKNSSSDLPALQNWIEKLLLLNQTYKHFDDAILKQVIFERVLKKCLRLADYNFSVISQLNEIKKILRPNLTWELRKKELAIIAFSTAHKKFMEV